MNLNKTVWIFKSGDLIRSDNTLLFQNDEGKKYLPVEGINEIFLFGEVTLNTKLLNFLSEKHIIMHTFNYYGYYTGSYYPREFLSSGEMIIDQAKAYMDQGQRFDVAYRIEMGASDNILSVLKYYLSRGKQVGNQIEEIKNLQRRFSEVKTIPELMGIEGRIRDIYYSAFDHITENEDFKFEIRSKRPPLNFLNSMISFGNSIMYSVCLAEIYKTHLDPRIGFLHESNFRRFSLNLDVSEIFKPIIIDRVILSLINEKMITNKDFESEGGIIIIKEKGKKTMVEAIDNKLSVTIKLKKIDHKVSYRTLIRMECYKIEKYLLGETDYVPFRSMW